MVKQYNWTENQCFAPVMCLFCHFDTKIEMLFSHCYFSYCVAFPFNFNGALGLISAQYYAQLSSYCSAQWKISVGIEVFWRGMMTHKVIF